MKSRDAARTASPPISKARQNQTAEIFTPEWLVRDMLDKLPSDVWRDPAKTFLEPACGDGNFLVAMLDRLMAGLADVIPDATARRRHIIERQLYGIDLMPDNVQATVRRLRAEGFEHNIVCADALRADWTTLFGKRP